MTIAVDFDGTIVEHRYPAIGREIPFALATLKRLQDDGHKIILWTVREGHLLQEVIDWCAERDFEFYGINSNYHTSDEEPDHHPARKLKADLFIDDRNVGGLPEWGVIYQLISEHITYEEYLRREMQEEKPKRRGLFRR